MGNPTSATTENPEPRRRGEAFDSEETPSAAIGALEAASSGDHEHPYRGPWPSEPPPTGLPTGMLGEMAHCYAACWHHSRSARR